MDTDDKTAGTLRVQVERTWAIAAVGLQPGCSKKPSELQPRPGLEKDELAAANLW